MVDKQKYIENFKRLFREKNPDQDITDATALEHFTKLVTLVSAVYQPISLSVFENSQCPLPLCQQKIKYEDFKDLQSIHEYLISGICEKCQREIFK